ncbi:MAG TPA: nucleoside triphosphate pyrophosphohydrolase, partial [Cyanobacteria bacterium UBA8553]|nr:nucleoside triphosphate pyrophosphohydrolase [Cyanobacteria bacterium UBA8553]
MSSSQEPSQIKPQSSALAALQQLIDVIAQLRSPVGGCPWDLAQTPQTLTPYVIEEAYEVVDAIRNGDKNAIAEELGDLLLQVVLQAQIASEEGHFTMTEVAQGITQKLIRRHPHVFGDVQ